MNGVAAFYRKHAERFDQVRERTLREKAYLEAVLAKLPPNGTVVELGCGAGEPIAEYFIDRGHAVTGVDAAAPMIALCQRRFPELTWVCADMRGLSLGKGFDLIVAWDSFFHLCPHDQRGMFATFELHSAPASLLLFTTGTHEGTSIGKLFGDELYHASLSSEEYQRRLLDHGYRVLRHSIDDPDCDRTVWLAQRDRA